jgi:beta-phosphoglucomutase-like phosphatase (HAD superfamily)
VVIEDSRSGIQAAINAGIGHVIALGPLTKHSELHQIEGVDQVIESLLEVQLSDLFL